MKLTDKILKEAIMTNPFIPVEYTYEDYLSGVMDVKAHEKVLAALKPLCPFKTWKLQLRKGQNEFEFQGVHFNISSHEYTTTMGSWKKVSRIRWKIDITGNERIIEWLGAGLNSADTKSEFVERFNTRMKEAAWSLAYGRELPFKLPE